MGGAHFAFTRRLSTAWFSRPVAVLSETPLLAASSLPNLSGDGACHSRAGLGEVRPEGKVRGLPAPERVVPEDTRSRRGKVGAARSLRELPVRHPMQGPYPS